MNGVRPDLVAEAIRLGLIEPHEADRYLRDRTTTKPLFLVPKVAPPPERIKLVTRPNGRLQRARSRLTKLLIEAKVLDAAAVTARRIEPTPNQHEESA